MTKTTSVSELLCVNLELSRLLAGLAETIIVSRAVEGRETLPTEYSDTSERSMEEFSMDQNMSTMEKLFYSESEEDEKFLSETFGSSDPPSFREQDPRIINSILEAAGLEPNATGEE